MRSLYIQFLCLLHHPGCYCHYCTWFGSGYTVLGNRLTRITIYHPFEFTAAFEVRFWAACVSVLEYYEPAFLIFVQLDKPMCKENFKIKEGKVSLNVCGSIKGLSRCIHLWVQHCCRKIAMFMRCLITCKSK